MQQRPSRPVVAVLAVAVAVAAAMTTACGSTASDGSASPAGGTTATAAVAMPGGTMPAPRRATIDGVAASILKAGAPAAYVGVWDPQEGAYTVAVGDAAPGRPATVDDHWRIGSITKTFTAVAVLQLADEGRLSLSDTVAEVDPALAERFPPLAGLTIRQLLSMRSGVADYLNDPKGVAQDVVADPSRVWAPDELIAAGVAAGVEAPGTPGYSTTNYIALQEIVEHLTGRPLADVIRDRIAAPLGLADTFLPPADDSTISEPSTTGTVAGTCKDELRSYGADVEGGIDTTDWSVSSGAGGGAMQSDLTELGQWAASVSGNTLLADGTAADRLETRQIQPFLLYGLGIMRAGPFVGHAGEEIGWESFAISDPATGRTVVLAGTACGIGQALYTGAMTIFPDAVLGLPG